MTALEQLIERHRTNESAMTIFEQFFFFVAQFSLALSSYNVEMVQKKIYELTRDFPGDPDEKMLLGVNGKHLQSRLIHQETHSGAIKDIANICIFLRSMRSPV